MRLDSFRLLLQASETCERLHWSNTSKFCVQTLTSASRSTITRASGERRRGLTRIWSPLSSEPRTETNWTVLCGTAWTACTSARTVASSTFRQNSRAYKCWPWPTWPNSFTGSGRQTVTMCESRFSADTASTSTSPPSPSPTQTRTCPRPTRAQGSQVFCNVEGRWSRPTKSIARRSPSRERAKWSGSRQSTSTVTTSVSASHKSNRNSTKALNKTHSGATAPPPKCTISYSVRTTTILNNFWKISTFSTKWAKL